MTILYINMVVCIEQIKLYRLMIYWYS